MYTFDEIMNRKLYQTPKMLIKTLCLADILTVSNAMENPANDGAEDPLTGGEGGGLVSGDFSGAVTPPEPTPAPSPDPAP